MSRPAAHNSLAASAGGGANAGQWDLADTPPCMVKSGSGQEEKGSPTDLFSWLWYAVRVSGSRCRQEDQGGEASGGDGRRWDDPYYLAVHQGEGSSLPKWAALHVAGQAQWSVPAPISWALLQVPGIHPSPWWAGATLFVSFCPPFCHVQTTHGPCYFIYF